MSDWYYAADDEQKGPINESELKADLATNKIPADTLVWKEGMDNWTPANQVPAFTFRPPPMPARVQPTAAAPAPVAEVTTAAAPAKTVVTAKAHAAVDNPDSTRPMDLASIIGPPESLEVDAEDAETNKVSGILAYVGPLFVVPWLNAKESPFCKYHANQGFVLFLVIVVALIVLGVGAELPFVRVIFNWLYIPLYLAILVMTVLGILNAANGKCVPLPLIGGIKLIIKPGPPKDQPPV